MRAGTHQNDQAKQAQRRAQANAWRKHRDVNVLREMEKARVAALPPRKLPGERVCLDCRVVFPSQWCGNRRCKLCADRNP